MLIFICVLMVEDNRVGMWPKLSFLPVCLGFLSPVGRARGERDIPKSGTHFGVLVLAD